MNARLDALANSIVYICLLWKISLSNDGIMSITKQTTNSKKTNVKGKAKRNLQ